MQTRTLSRLFQLSMWWRIFYGSVRAVLGLMLLKMINVPFADIFYQVLRYEISEDPTDHIVYYIGSFLEDHSFTVTGFIAAYLIFWGVLDVVMSLCLLRHMWWAFPVSLYLIGFFILYECFRFFHTHSLVLLSVILIDLFIFWIIWREYTDIEKKHNEHFIHQETVTTAVEPTEVA